MPPLVFFNLGIPPAKSPPNCGAASAVLDDDAPPVSLLLRFLFEFEGTGGARPPGGLIPGIGGAPATGPPELGLSATMGAERSLVTVAFNFLPLLISVSSAPCHSVSFIPFRFYHPALEVGKLFGGTYTSCASGRWSCR